MSKKAFQFFNDTLRPTSPKKQTNNQKKNKPETKIIIMKF